jgi:PTS system cellobiose-specific IIB component
MLTVTLICNLGMSTSMLLKKMTEYAKEKGVEANIDAIPFFKLGEGPMKTDILLLGPQVRHLLKKMRSDFGGRIPVIQVINMSHYALLKAGEIFDEAYSEYLSATERQ